MRCVEPAHLVLAQGKLLPIGESPCRAVGNIVHRHMRRNVSAQGHGTRRGGKELVQCAALVGLEMRQPDEAQAIDRHDALDRLAHQGKHFARPGMKQQRLVIHHDVLVEIELRAARNGSTGVLIR